MTAMMFCSVFLRWFFFFFYPLNCIQVCSLLFQPVCELRVCILFNCWCSPPRVLNRKKKIKHGLIHLKTRTEVVVWDYLKLRLFLDTLSQIYLPLIMWSKTLGYNCQSMQYLLLPLGLSFNWSKHSSWVFCSKDCCKSVWYSFSFWIRFSKSLLAYKRERT